jgi:hypothetical protein
VVLALLRAILMMTARRGGSWCASRVAGHRTATVLLLPLASLLELRLDQNAAWMGFEWGTRLAVWMAILISTRHYY